MDDRKLRYDRNFLNLTKENIINNSNKKYSPKYHVFPYKGLLNDPNCVFYKDGKFFIFFQHHPNNPIHGLKTMSLATTKDFKKIEYDFMVNKPLNSFESHGVYSGNAIEFRNKIICFYSGNSRDGNWDRTSHVVKSEFDIETKTFKHKEFILSNKNYLQYTDHFRDPFVFEYKNEFYFLLGAQRKKDIKGVILLFKLNDNLNKATLIKEFGIGNEYRMIECPSFCLIKNKVILLFSPQYKIENIEKTKNPDIAGYSIIDNFDEILNSNIFEFELSNFKTLDYGLEFYAPQTFLIDNQWHLIAWCGIPTSNNYLESKDGWIFMLTMVKKIDLINNELILSEINNYKQLYLQEKDSFIKYIKENININEEIVIFDEEEENQKLIIKNCGDKVVIERQNDKEYFPYNSTSIVDIQTKLVNLEIYIDNSIIEMKINNKWYTSRLYFEKSIKLIKKKER